MTIPLLTVIRKASGNALPSPLNRLVYPLHANMAKQLNILSDISYLYFKSRKLYAYKYVFSVLQEGTFLFFVLLAYCHGKISSDRIKGRYYRAFLYVSYVQLQEVFSFIRSITLGYATKFLALSNMSIKSYQVTVKVVKQVLKVVAI